MATVLIGENVSDLAHVLRRLFTRAGHQTHTTVTGDATLAHARDNTPDLIIMNPSLPGLDGLDVCRQLRAGPATAHLPVIMVSVRHWPAEVAAAHAAGADDYIGKPFDNHDLLQRAETLIHRTAGAAGCEDRISREGQSGDRETADQEHRQLLDERRPPAQQRQQGQ